MYIYISKIDYRYDNTVQHTNVYVNKVKRKQCTRQLISYEIRFNKKTHKIMFKRPICLFSLRISNNHQKTLQFNI